MGLGGGWVDGWVQESDGLMEGWMDTFVLEWMSGGGTNGWVCVYLVGRGGEQTAAGWMEGWPTPAWKRLGGPCSLRQGLLLAQPAAGQPADHTRPWSARVRLWCLGAEVAVKVGTAPACPSRTLRAGSVGVSPHRACPLSSHGQGRFCSLGGGHRTPVRFLPVGPHPWVLWEVSEAPEPSGRVEKN